jgi:hypothetical protein
MSTTSACANPMCSCDPCGCDDCKCGVARLGELERRVMEILWASDDREVSVRDVAGELPDYAYTTVATVSCAKHLGRTTTPMPHCPASWRISPTRKH